MAASWFYLTDGVLVLTEERLQLQAFGRSQSSDLSVRRHGHRGRLGQQTVEQPQQRERHQVTLRRPAGRDGLISLWLKPTIKVHRTRRGPADLAGGQDERAAEAVVSAELRSAESLLQAGNQELEKDEDLSPVNLNL